ncbi:MAG TPA: hypothetical protein VE669_07990 [Actinomycetota bacterium]|nr:hypothetical protein [Actinomycetota bacterium]
MRRPCPRHTRARLCRVHQLLWLTVLAALAVMAVSMPGPVA